MKSFCIKTNNNEVINYLLKNLECMEIENVYYINRRFKIYSNVIIHYTGNNKKYFIHLLSTLITNTIINFYEPILIKRNLNYNYFYFDDFEKKVITNIALSFINSNEDDIVNKRYKIINKNIKNYILNNKSLILSSFVNFKLLDYTNILDDIIDFSVNKYVVEKEYNEFIDLLKVYVLSKPPGVNKVHLIYTNGESILLDDKTRNIISFDYDMSELKYLSDISFSSNDYALNTLLTLLPEIIEIHVIGYEDEFINTLKLIFESKINICKRLSYM